MIADLKPYAKTGQSSIAWLDEIPVDWSIKPLRTLIRARSQKGRSDLPLLSVAREKGVFERAMDGSDGNHNLIPTDLTGYKVALKGDLVINKMKAWQGSMGVAPVDGVVSPAYYVYELGMENERFGQALLRSKPYVAEFGRASDGVRIGQWDLSIPRMREIPVLQPPAPDQEAIVRFLDYANHRIDRFVRSKRKLIALLNEQKQAIINRAVTRGLDPDVPLKPSGIPWLGDIPTHWEAHRLSSLAKFQNGKAHEPFVNDKGPHICVTARFVSTNGVKRRLCSRNLCPATPGDILMVMSDLPNGRALARAFYVEDGASYAVNQRVCVITASKVDSRFLYYFMDRNWGLLRHNDGSNQTHLSTGDYKTLPILIPPRKEQESIASMLDRATLEIRCIIERSTEEINLIEEYRTRLTSDIVTGQLDVREASIPDGFGPDIGDETEEAESFDDSLDEELAAEEAEL